VRIFRPVPPGKATTARERRRASALQDEDVIVLKDAESSVAVDRSRDVWPRAVPSEGGTPLRAVPAPGRIPPLPGAVGRERPVAAGANAQLTCSDVADRVVLRLNAICRAATLDFALSVGRLIMTDVYGGDLAGWRDRNPKKDHSLRKIANHPDLPMSPAALYRSVAMFELCERLGTRSWKHVSTTHLRLVLPLGKDDQVQLLRDAEANRWSVRRLNSEIAGLERAAPSACASRGGRKRLVGLSNRIRALEKVLQTVNEMVSVEDDGLGPADAKDVTAAVDLLQRVARGCGVLEARWERRQLSETEADPTERR
jgi:hypothetical protein